MIAVDLREEWEGWGAVVLLILSRTVKLLALLVFSHWISGMSTHDFKGISSLQEVECKGTYLNPDVQLLSLKLFRITDSSLLASLNVFRNSCVTFGDFSSCFVDTVDTHKSSLRTLVVDLDEGESKAYGCNASTLNSLGYTQTLTWTILVTRRRKLV